MADYTIVLVLVEDILPGGGLRVLRNGTVTIKSAADDAVLGTATTNSNGRAVVTSPTPTIYYVTANGFVSDHITAGSILESAAAAALNNDAGVASFITDTSPSSTRAALNTAMGDEAADGTSDLGGYLSTNFGTPLAGKVGKGTLVYYAGDYPSIQACLDAAPAGSIVKLDSATITAPLSITKAVNIVGGGNRNTLITANGCDAFVVANGVGDVTIQRLAIRSLVKYTTTVNTTVGIRILGDSTHRPSVHTYRDLYIEGFWTGIQANYLWTSTFDNVQTAYGLYGINVYGLSENNTVSNSNLVVGIGSQTRLAGSACIRLNGQVSESDSTALVSEGWIITSTLMYGGDYGVNARGYANYQVANCILDAIQIAGVLVIHNGTAYGGNALIQGNYIAMAANAVTTVGAVEIANTVGSPRGVRIIGNDILANPGASAPYGVHVIAGTGTPTTVMGNTIWGFTTSDVDMSSSDNIVVGNRCLSTAVTHNIITASGQSNLVEGNVGIVYVSGSTVPNSYGTQGGFKIARHPAVPTTGTFKRGDRVYNYAPAVGQPKSWVCTVAGSPGTWVSEGNL